LASAELVFAELVFAELVFAELVFAETAAEPRRTGWKSATGFSPAPASRPTCPTCPV
jgi:hypothetical protein